MKGISRQITVIGMLLVLLLPSLCMADGPLTIVTAQMLTDGNVDTPYTETFLSASGGTSPYTWNASGILPPGITVSSNGGISGTPTSGGNYTFMVTVTDAVSATASKQMLLGVTSPPVVMPISKPAKYSNCTNCHTEGQPTPGAPVTTLNTYPPSSNNTSDAAFWFTTNVPNYTIKSECSIDGEPFTTCESPAVYYSLSDGPHAFMVRSVGKAGEIETPPVSYSWNIFTAPLVIDTSALPNARVGSYYEQTLTSSGGVPPITWYIPPGYLPAGLNLDPSTGVISGTPISSGNSWFTVQASDFFSSVVTKQLGIQVLPPLPLLIDTSSLPSGSTGSFYSAALTASGGVPTYSWSIDSGSLPAGLTLTGSTGEISGTPSATGTFPVTFKLADSASVTATTQLTIEIAESLRVLPYYGPYSTLQDGFSNVLNGGMIQLFAKTFPEHAALSRPVAITLKGGYGPAYTSNPDISYIQGSLTITSGRITIENIAIR